jgi:hypothetical protein
MDGDNVQWMPLNDPSKLVPIGLTAAGEPINDQVWAKFRGSMGSVAAALRLRSQSDVHASHFPWNMRAES